MATATKNQVEGKAASGEPYPELLPYPKLRKIVMQPTDHRLTAVQKAKDIRREFAALGWEAARWGMTYRPATPKGTPDRGLQVEEYREVRPATWGEFGSVRDFLRLYVPEAVKE